MTIQVTNAAPENSKTDRSFQSMLSEVKAQSTVQSSVETLLIGIGTLSKEGHFDDDGSLDRILNKYTKAAGEAVISGTPAQVSHDTSGRAVLEVTADNAQHDYDPKTTPGQIPSEADSIPRDLPEVEKGAKEDHKGHKAKK